MVEKIDIPSLFSEIDTAIKTEDHETVLNLSEKILKADPKDKEAMQCKIISLINLSKNDELITFIDKNGLVNDYFLEYAYALHDKKKYQESINILNTNVSKKEMLGPINELLAQNYYKMGKYEESHKLYKEMVMNKNDEPDLITNYLASFILSGSNELINTITKHLNSWESFYNYCIISIKEGNFSEAIETVLRIKQEYATELDEHKALSLDMSILQTALDGIDYTKFTNIPEGYEKYFSANKSSDLYPYFYNNFLHARKDKDSIAEILKKYDTFLKNENLSVEERYIFSINKLVFLLRANRVNEAVETFKNITPNFKDAKYIIIYCYLSYKQGGLEKVEEVINKDIEIKNHPESHIVLLQLMLSTISSKNIESFHLKVLNFIKQFFSFTVNYHFINFFIGFYESRHLKDYLREFIRNYKDPSIFKDMDRSTMKKAFTLLGQSFLKVGLFEESLKFYNYIIENIDKFDKDIKLKLIDTLAHIDLKKSEDIRRSIDDTNVDLSLENINKLLNDVSGKSRTNEEKTKKNKKKKKNVRYPKNFDPSKPGQLPDPERWIPRLQRKKFRNIAKNKLAYQGAVTDNVTTASKK